MFLKNAEKLCVQHNVLVTFITSRCKISNFALTERNYLINSLKAVIFYCLSAIKNCYKQESKSTKKLHKILKFCFTNQNLKGAKDIYFCKYPIFFL